MSESKTPKEKELSPRIVWDWSYCETLDEQYEMENLATDTLYEQRTLERLKNELSSKKTAGEDGTDELAKQIIEQEAKVKEMKDKLKEMKYKFIDREWKAYEEELREEARKLIDSI